MLHVNLTDEVMLEDEPEEAPKPENHDALGAMLYSQWDSWATIRREIEEEWLRDLRAFNQQNEPDVAALSQFHSHIYYGMTRTKCLSAYSRITDLMFQTGDDHWGINATPVPNGQNSDDPFVQAYQDEMARRVELMRDEMDDQLIGLQYEDKLKAAILEGCILGTGVVKGITPGFRTIQPWAMMNGVWDVVNSEIPYPEMGACSIFDVYPDPYANSIEDMSGCYERHILNRQQFKALADDSQFDGQAIKDILKATDKGNYTALYHETERRKIAGITDTSGSQAERYELVEYWGQVSGRMLVAAGLEIDDEEETYWANVWVSQGKTLLAKLMPMKKQRIPYNFFIYAKIPHQFWGIGPARMIRYSQYSFNGANRAYLDNMAISALPQIEVDVRMLKDGEDPAKIVPGRVWTRDSGDPDTPAVRFSYPDSKGADFINMSDQFKKLADEESLLPSYTHGDQIQGLNKTASGMSMLMGAANITIKTVVKNLEDFCIKPLLQSLFDWNMQWSDKDEIKGDMNIEVRGSSALIAKEMQSQRLIEFLQLTANPIDLQYTDRRYLLKEAANALDIDADKAIPEPQDIYNGQDPSLGNPALMQPPGMGGFGGLPQGTAPGVTQGAGVVPGGQTPEATGAMPGYQ
jgi:hypothetical protein